jgi:long-chain acyl-CoA synthetase
MIYNFDEHTLGDIPHFGAEDFGDLPALSMVGGEALSYRQLEASVRRAALDLRALGIAKGDRVVLLSENRPEWGIASFGIARAGAVSVPILVDFPAEQVRNIIQHSEAKVVWASAKQRRKLDGLDPGVVILPIEELGAADRRIWDDGLDLSVLPAVASSDLAAIVYTSGTTGRSKGVMLTHRNFIADALACESVIVLNTKDVLLSILPLAHTYEYTIGFLIPTMSGSSINYLDKPPSASVLLPTLASLKPTIVLSVPLVIEKVYRSGVKPKLEKMALYRLAFFRPLLDRLAGRSLMRSFGGRIRFFGVGGAPLDPEVEAFLIRARFPHAIGYGLTETAPIIAAAKVGSTKVKMAGPPLGGAEIRILPLPGAKVDGAEAGAQAGEIIVRGPMVGPGYFKDPERTAEAFPADGFFHTGDLGFFDRRGRLYVRGRSKTMILGASGENIYPEEVEAILNSSPFVAESLVYGDDDGLTALVQLKPEIMDELSGYLREGLQGAEKAAAKFGQSVGQSLRRALEQAGEAEKAAEVATKDLLARVKREANERLAAFSRIHKVEVQVEPFEKTPTQKIKRFLYPRREK